MTNPFDGMMMMINMTETVCQRLDVPLSTWSPEQEQCLVTSHATGTISHQLKDILGQRLTIPSLDAVLRTW